MPNVPSSIYPTVTRYADGQRLDAATMNVPIDQLTRRTAFLDKRLAEVSGSQNNSSLRICDVFLESDVKTHDFVYLNPATGLFCKAKASVLLQSNPFQVSTGNSLVVGMVVVARDKDDSGHYPGDVILSGLFDFSGLMAVQSMLEPGATFKSGPYYLSSKVPGKITPDPSGPAIYLGTFFSDEAPGDNPEPENNEQASVSEVSDVPFTANHGTWALLSPQYKDLAEMHHHRAFVLSGAVHSNGVVSAILNNGTSIIIAETGKYDIILDPENSSAKIVNSIADQAGSYSGYTEDSTWSVVGSFNNWGADVSMVTNGALHVCKGVDFSVGDEFKFRNGGSWDTNFGYAEGVDSYDIGEWFDLDQCDVGASIRLYVSGTYTGTRLRHYSIRFVYSNNGTSFNVAPSTITASWSDNKSYIECTDDDNVTTYHPIRLSGSGDLEFSIGTHGLVGHIPGIAYGPVAASFPTFTTNDIKGWNPTFDEDPDGYSYKYEVGLDPDLAQFFPPFPINGTAFVMNGVEYSSVNLWGKERGAYFVANTAIYWKGEDPLTDAAFYLTRGAFPSSSFVTSIKAAKDSGIKIRQDGTSDIASTGNLVIDAQIPIEKSNPGLAGWQVVKDVVNNKLIFGPVVSSLSAGPGISLQSRLGQPYGCGDIRISIDGAAAIGGSFDDIVLHNAKQELIGHFPYVKLLGQDDVASAFTMKMHVPIMLDPDPNGYSLCFFMSVFGVEDVESGPAYAGINIQASVLQDWYPDISGGYSGTLKNCTSIPPADENLGVYAITLGTQNGSYSAFDPVFVHNMAMFGDEGDNSVLQEHIMGHQLLGNNQPAGAFIIDGLQPNAHVAITISRAHILGNDSAYSYGLGFMDMGWRLIPSATSEG